MGRVTLRDACGGDLNNKEFHTPTREVYAEKIFRTTRDFDPLAYQ